MLWILIIDPAKNLFRFGLGINCFADVYVSGRNLVPLPPANMNAFIIDYPCFNVCCVCLRKDIFVDILYEIRKTSKHFHSDYVLSRDGMLDQNQEHHDLWVTELVRQSANR